ncbi:putative flavo involved in k+ transport [Fusarium longipes]|uniref:Putative flavo involved in k+ transport n=1 Tax=Fusarium longipes TaxID=694270 RepID=A0A395TA28_9HYPO|nr:putative flavo involved in k+ transport [Fusarium longipes]
MAHAQTSIGDLRKLFEEHPIPVISPETDNLISFAESSESEQASLVVDAFNIALISNDIDALQECFHMEQCYWKDLLAFTYTFVNPEVIARNITKLKGTRQCEAGWKLEDAVFVPATPILLLASQRLTRVKKDYEKQYQGEHLRSKDELADQLRRFISSFKLNVITSAHIQSTLYNKPTKRWIMKVRTPTVIFYTSAKHLVQATGIASQKSYVPSMIDAQYTKAPTYILPSFTVVRHDLSGQLARNHSRMLASQEPDRYSALAKAGFPVLDSCASDQALYSNSVEMAGGYYIDTGGTKILAQRKANVEAGVELVAFTETGLVFSDGSKADTGAVIWCTGFADRDACDTAVEILGGNKAVNHDYLMDPGEIAARLDATWGVDSEGEISGMWKRHSRLENYWIIGGFTQQHKWYSQVLALQIKAELMGILPEAYRES